MNQLSTIAQRIPDKPPVIRPVAKGVKRPLWSVMIPVYNCSQYLRETLEGVLHQAPTTDIMQIEVVDDGSSDLDVKELVYEIGQGRVDYYRQEQNVGSLRNFQTCIERSRGHLIHILHGDDKVKPGFYKKFESLFAQYPQIGAGFCRYAYINELSRLMYYQEAEMDQEGILENWLTRLCERQRIQYVSIVVRRAVYEKLGSFYGVEYGEDWEMWVRIAARYKMAYLPEVLAEYRKHFSSISGKSFLTGKNMHELTTVMDKIQHYIPEKRRTSVIKSSKRFYAHYALRVANDLWKYFKHRQGAASQVKAAWSMSRDITLFYKILKLYTRITLNI